MNEEEEKIVDAGKSAAEGEGVVLLAVSCMEYDCDRDCVVRLFCGCGEWA